MTFDFRASQLRTSKIIASGSTGTNAKVLLYPISADEVPLNQGNIKALVFGTGSIGRDVFLYVSGGIGGMNGTSHDISVFGGDTHISGNLFVSGTLNTSLGGVATLPKASPSDLLAGASPNTIFVVDGVGDGVLLGINALPVASFQISDGGTVGIPVLVSNTILSAQNAMSMSRDFVSRSLYQNVGDILTKGTASLAAVSIGSSGSYLKSNGTTFNWEFAPRLPSKNIGIFNYSTTDTNVETLIGGIYFVPSENSSSGFTTSNNFECVGFVVGTGTGSVTLYNSTDSTTLATLLFSGSNNTYNSSTFSVNPTGSLILEARCSFYSGSVGAYAGFFGGQIKVNYAN